MKIGLLLMYLVPASTNLSASSFEENSKTNKPVFGHMHLSILIPECFPIVGLLPV